MKVPRRSEYGDKIQHGIGQGDIHEHVHPVVDETDQDQQGGCFGAHSIDAHQTVHDRRSGNSTIEGQQHQQAQIETEMVKIAGKLDGQQLNLKAKVGAKDRLYGSITSADIAAGLERATGIAVDKRKIDLGKPIHQLGSFDITIKLDKGVHPRIKVIVSEEEPDNDAG